MKYEAAVVHGHGRGKKMGFPTFNLEIPRDFDMRHGIYAAWAWIGDERFMAAAHYGPVPTFNESDPTLELFLLNYEEEIHPERLTFELVSYLRPIQTFKTPEALSEQIAEDVRTVRLALSE